MKEHLTIICDDACSALIGLPEQSVQCCVTSPPYWGLRDYGVNGQIGLEQTPQEYVDKMVGVFRYVKRVMRDDGTLWLNLGDSYAGGGNYRGVNSEDTLSKKQSSNRGARGLSQALGAAGKDFGIAPKNLVGIPWRVAFALQSDGWYLRSDIIWHKTNPMPESVTDRPTKSHEYLFLLTKNERYYYDSEAIKEPSVDPEGSAKRYESEFGGIKADTRIAQGLVTTPKGMREFSGSRNRRSVWTVSTAPYSGAHFATYPPALIKPCILAGTKPGDIVLDPFAGSGTTGAVALELGRKAILIELNPDYIKLINERCAITPRLALF